MTRICAFVDFGASQLIIDGKIKLKNDSQIAAFTESGLKFENGSELAADVVVFATGHVLQFTACLPDSLTRNSFKIGRCSQRCSQGLRGRRWGQVQTNMGSQRRG